ncbi:MAG: phosphatidylserine decarboxylase [Legionellales bacterium]|nr:phosphatidylserine decarboxylase [Legionellales bacterium]
MKQWLFLLLQYLLPHHALSRLIGQIAHCRWRWLSQLCIRAFCKWYPVNLAEAQLEAIPDYPSLQDFFIRELKPNARTFPTDPKAIISPVDGNVSELGHIDQQTLIQAKGKHYTTAALLGCHDRAAAFTNGQFMTIYLAPADYHRVHMPISGRLTQMTYIPGRLFSVQPATMQQIDGLLTRNERVICYFDTVYGPIAVILVGAMIVASMATAWHGVITPTRCSTIQTWQYTTESITLKTGDPLGYFNFGSTVVLLTNHPDIHWQLPHAPSSNVQLGNIIS